MSTRGTFGRSSSGTGDALSGCLSILALSALFLLALSAALMVTWNAVIPYVFGLPALDFPKAVAMLVVAQILIHNTTIGGNKND